MHFTRKESPIKLPIKRKGTKYLAAPSSHHQNAVATVIALRDMINIAHTAKEVRNILKNKQAKLNGRIIKSYNQSILLFNILEVGGKSYELQLLPTGKFVFVETKSKEQRLVKVIGKKKLPKNKNQLNLHDGSNIIGPENIQVGDSLILDFSGKIKKHISLEKGADVWIIAGKHIGHRGNILERKDKNLTVQFIKTKEGTAEINISNVIVQ